ncbi:hypothetical protein SAMN05192561_1035 [Halopenitus malekzadehii]|uniref:Uncharacterized protein n=2 Tax=Halopenitus malekzadehii TaxID=1267564 RepID=A0A1H6IQM1_9EURY|nr:hypothetical protein SAMN05192561_1035 [Halopenitus malekzadehii]
MGDRDRMTLPEEDREGASPGDDEWPAELAELSADRREELLARAVVRLAEERGVDVPDSETLDRVREGLDRTDAELDRIETDVETLRDELDEQIADVRERVISVLQEAESRASKDHTHPEIDDRLGTLRSTVQSVSTRIDDLEGDVDAAETRVDGVRADVDAHAERVSDHDEKLTRLAGALVNAQRRLDRLETTHARRDAHEALLEEANRNGVAEAACESCEKSVRIGLLGRARCPHCDSHFTGVEPKSGFFGSAWLLVGDPPALEGDTTEPREAADVFEGEGESE